MTQLPNHLRSHRKRLALSQDEAAFLIGTHGATSVCRYEQFDREPSLEDALAFEVIFQKPVRELFPGLYRKVEKTALARVKVLMHKTDRGKQSRQNIRKRRALASITTSESNNLQQA